MGHQERHTAGRDYLCSGAAEAEEAQHLATTVGAHHQQVGALLVRIVEEVTTARPGRHRARIDRVDRDASAARFPRTPEAERRARALILEALRAELGIAKAHFAGHSLGGMIGPAYARKYPQHLLSLGLYSTAAFRTADDSTKVKGVVAAMRAKGIPQVLETLKDRWFTPEFGQRQPEVIARRMQQVIDTVPLIDGAERLITTLKKLG